MAPRREKNPARRFTVAVIGGGFSGTVLAARLIRDAGPSFTVVVIEKVGLPGRGIAYGTKCAAHLLNVPAERMSAFPEDREHFLRWAKVNHDRESHAFSFLPRKVYGRYVGAVLSDAIAAGGRRRLQWKKNEARSLSYGSDGEIEILLSDGSRVSADKVVLAQGNFPSSDPFPPELEPPSGRYFSNPWTVSACESVARLDSILLLGSGLTSVDVAVELRQAGFAGTIHCLSRRGLLPHSQAALDPWPVFWNEHSPRNIRDLLRLVRQEVRKAQAQGIDWRGVIGSLRPVTQQIWESLPIAERRRFLRHGRPYWDVHRHRAAPEIGKCIDDQRSSGKFHLHAGRITDCKEDALGAKVTYRKRRNGEEVCLAVDRIINCTGPETDCRRLHDPLMADLLARGWVRPDPLRLGFDVSADGALIGQDGNISDSLYAVGPARKGRLWESTAVPEIREQVYHLAEHLMKATASHHAGLDRAHAVRRDITNL